MRSRPEGATLQDARLCGEEQEREQEEKEEVVRIVLGQEVALEST